MKRTPARLSHAFLQALQSDAELTRRLSVDLEERLAELLERGQRAWPTLVVDPEGWMKFLAKRVASSASVPSDGLPEVPHAEDLFLTYGCVVGAPGALAAFEKAHFTNLPGHLAQLSLPRDLLEDVGQTLRAKLFVAKEGAERGLHAYSGRGPLGAWFRVTALNTALKLLRAETTQRPRETLSAVSRADSDPERKLIRARTRAEMEETLRRVLVEAPARERALLRMHFVDGSTLEELAEVFDVGRTTVVRWIRSARQSILRETQRQMVERLKLSPSELSSTFRMTRSEWSFSLETALASEEK